MKLSPTEGSPTVAHSEGYINGSQNMGASHMEDEQVGPKAKHLMLKKGCYKE
jgi:hypothetical protein